MIIDPPGVFAPVAEWRAWLKTLESLTPEREEDITTVKAAIAKAKTMIKELEGE